MPVGPRWLGRNLVPCPMPKGQWRGSRSTCLLHRPTRYADPDPCCRGRNARCTPVPSPWWCPRAIRRSGCSGRARYARRCRRGLAVLAGSSVPWLYDVVDIRGASGRVGVGSRLRRWSGLVSRVNIADLRYPCGGGVRRGYGADVSDEVAPVGASVLPEVDEVLAAALVAQGDAGVRALDLLRDAHRVLSGGGFARLAEVAAACVRSAADALLGLPGAPVTVGLKPAAKGLLAAVDAVAPLAAAEVLGPRGIAGPLADKASLAAEQVASSAQTSPAAGSAGTAVDDAADGQSGTSAEARAAWERVTAAADVLRDELSRPGRYHQARARGVIERLMNVELGAAQETALDVWSMVYAVASGILHGRSADPGEAVLLYTDILGAARELLVPLPGRAARVLELAALQHPGAAEAKEMAGWADPRATDYFFRSTPAPAWLTVLAEHAGHLLLPEPSTGGRWPAAPFVEHLADAAPDSVRAWLAAEGAVAAGRAQQIAAAGSDALNALLRLAIPRWEVLPADQMRLVLTSPGARVGGGRAVGATLSLAVRWARLVPPADRTREWILTVEGLLAGAIEDEHPAQLALRAAVDRMTAEMKATGLRDDVAEAVARWKTHEMAEREGFARLGGPNFGLLLGELVRTAYPAGRRGAAHPHVSVIRAIVANLLRRDLELTPDAARPTVFHADLDQVDTDDLAVYDGVRLARTLLDLAAADADAGTGLAERTRHLGRLAGVDGRLRCRLLASHLAHRPPAVDGLGEWWKEALELVPQVLADNPAPESARLVEMVLRTCPPEHTATLETGIRTALGTGPADARVEKVLPAGAEQVDRTAQPLASWLRVWEWSPVLPARLLAGWEPVLNALRRTAPAGPADPRAASVLEPVRATTALDVEDLEETAAAAGPPAAAAALAGAEDAGAEGYAMVLYGLVSADPAAWTSNVPAVLEALDRPELAAFYLAAAANHADQPGALAGNALSAAVTAALDLSRGLPESTPETGPDDDIRRWPAAGHFADEALFGLLTHTWRTGAGLADDQEAAALAYLHALAAPLTRTTDPPAEDGQERTLQATDPEVWALRCLLEYAVHQAHTYGEMPAEVLDAVAGTLAAHGDQDAVATAIGVHLPALHRHAPAFTASHRTALYGLSPGRPSPAASWLRWGPHAPSLLAALDHAELLHALRHAVPGAAKHMAHALLADTAFLGDPTAAWAEVAAGTGGPGAASRLLEAIAAGTPRTSVDVPLPPTEQARVAGAVDLWRAALAAGLPQGALAGAGAFANTALSDNVWLSLARASAEHTLALTNTERVAERAARHPGSDDALLLASQLVTHAPGTRQETAVQRHTRALLDAAAALPADERPAALEELRTALVNAGDVDAALP